MTFKIKKTQAFFILGMKDNSMSYYTKKAGKKTDKHFMFITEKDLKKVCKKNKWNDETFECLYHSFCMGLNLYDFYDILSSILNKRKNVDINAFKRLARLITYYYKKQLNYNIYKIILKSA